MSVNLFELLLPFMFIAFGAICLLVWYFVIFPRTSEYLVIRYKRVNGRAVDVSTKYLTYKQYKQEQKHWKFREKSGRLENEDEFIKLCLRQQKSNA